MTANRQDLIRVIAEEMADGVDTAVDCWMTQIDSALTDTRLSPLGRLNAVQEVYLIASSGFLLLGWVVLLLVAYALAFQGDSA